MSYKLSIKPIVQSELYRLFTCKFMPYSGIRASFCLKGLGIKRLSNGIIEKVWQTKKNKNPAQFPANYDYYEKLFKNK